MATAEHAPRSPIEVLEDRHGLFNITFSGVGVLLEAFGQENLKVESPPIVESQMAHVRDLFSQQFFGLGELP